MNDYLVIVDEGGEQTRAQAADAATAAATRAVEAAASASTAAAKAAEAANILGEVEKRANANLDGGNARSVYMTFQIHDGGGAADV